MVVATRPEVQSPALLRGSGGWWRVIRPAGRDGKRLSLLRLLLAALGLPTYLVRNTYGDLR